MRSSLPAMDGVQIDLFMSLLLRDLRHFCSDLVYSSLERGREKNDQVCDSAAHLHSLRL